MHRTEHHEASYILKSRSTGKFLAMDATGFCLVNRQEEAQRFCVCHAPEIAGIASKVFDMGFRVIEATK